MLTTAPIAAPPAKPWETPQDGNENIGNMNTLSYQQPYGGMLASPYYTPQHPYGGVQPHPSYFPPPLQSAISGLQEGSHQLTSTLSSTMASLSAFVQLVDTAVYSAWSSLNSIMMLVGRLDDFNRRYVGGILGVVRGALRRLLEGAFGTNGGGGNHTAAYSRRGRIMTVIMGVALALAFLVKKAIAEYEGTRLVKGDAKLVRMKVTATHEFTATLPTHLPLTAGQVVSIAGQDRERIGHVCWLHGRNEAGQEGFFPGNYVCN